MAYFDGDDEEEKTDGDAEETDGDEPADGAPAAA